MSTGITGITAGHFPPKADLAKVLLSSSSSALATRVFADPNSGYPSGLHLNAALNENDSGRFSLVSGLTIAGNAAKVAEAQLNRIQELFDSVETRIGIIGSDKAEYSQADKDQQKLLLKFDLEDIEKAVADAQVGNINLLDATNSYGTRLDLTSGAYENVGVSTAENAKGQAKSLKYDSNALNFETRDIRAAFEDLNKLQLLTFENTEESLQSNGNYYALSRFQNAIDQSKEALKDYRSKLNNTAIERITVSTEPTQGNITNGEQARQIASRLAQQLSNEAFNITANPVAKYFSLFT